MIDLMVTCDDGGLSEGIDAQVIAHHRAGMASIVSVLPNFGRRTQAGLDRFGRHPALEIGAHLNLMEGYAVSDVMRGSHFTDDAGRFHPRTRMFPLLLLAGRDAQRIIAAELAAQLDQFTSAGYPPLHITTHMHFHALPTVHRLVMQLAQDYGVRWIRSTAVTRAVIPYNALRVLGRGHKTADRAVRVPDYLVSIFHWIGHEPRALVRALLNRRGTVELVVHPASAQDADFPPDIRYPPRRRQQESAYLARVWEQLAPHIDKQTVRLHNALDWMER